MKKKKSIDEFIDGMKLRFTLEQPHKPFDYIIPRASTRHSAPIQDVFENVFVRRVAPDENSTAYRLDLFRRDACRDCKNYIGCDADNFDSMIDGIAPYGPIHAPCVYCLETMAAMVFLNNSEDEYEGD